MRSLGKGNELGYEVKCFTTGSQGISNLIQFISRGEREKK